MKTVQRIMRMKPLRLFAVFLLLAAVEGYAAPRTAPVGSPSYLPGEILVKYRLGRETAGRASLSALGLPRATVSGFDRMALSPGLSVEEGVRNASGNPEVEWAQPNYIYRALDCIPSDPFYDDDGQGWIWRMIHAPAAWGLMGTCAAPPGSSSITIAVLDTGADAAHPDLTGCLVPGYNEVGNNTNTADDDGHGTFVSGLAAGVWNGSGAVGLAGGVRILPVKVLDSSGNGATSDIIAGVQYAVSHGAKILNMSFGGSGMGPAEQAGYDGALAAGCVLVAASGNDGGPVLYPAAYPPIVAVGGVDSTGAPVTWANHGTGLDLVAPVGEGYYSYQPTLDVFSTVWTGSSTTDYVRKTAAGAGHTADDRYGTNAGTSFAVPMVSAAAALVWTLFPSLSASDVVAHLQFTADPIGTPGWHPESGWGLLNVAAVLTPVVYTPTNSPTPTPTPTSTPTPTRTPTPQVPVSPVLAPNPYDPALGVPARLFIPKGAVPPVTVDCYDTAGERVCRQSFGASDLQPAVAGAWKDASSVLWYGCALPSRRPAAGYYILVVETAGQIYRLPVILKPSH